MENQEFLQTIAEVAVALVGFSGIVVTMGRRRNWDKAAIRNLVAMLRAGLSAMFLSFLPIVLNLYIPSAVLWRSSIAVLTVVMASNLFVFLWRSRLAGMSLSHKLMFPPGAVIAVAGFLAAIGVLNSASNIYLLALIWMLFVSSHNFVLLLIDSLILEQETA